MRILKKGLLMRNYLVGTFLCATLFIGCGSDGGHCCGTSGIGALGGLGNIADGTENPVAKFDINWTTEYKGQSAGSLQDVTNQQEASSSENSQEIEYINFNFDCSISYDQDEDNNSIEKCAWDFTTPVGSCLDRNSTVEGIVVPLQACAEIIDNNMTVVLTVTDDENWTDEVNVTLATSIDNEGILLLSPTLNK